MKLALVGNPNCGKTTLFNILTNSNAKVGNFPGVTVEKREAKIKKDDLVLNFVDLPGVYSLSPFSQEEVISRNYIFDEDVDVIVNVVDASNLERNLYLTTQVLEIGIKTVVALNLYDVVEANGDKLDVVELESRLGCKVVPVSAKTGKGVAELVDIVSAELKPNKKKTLITHTEVLKAVDHIRENIVSKGNKTPDFFNCVKLLEEDKVSLKYLKSKFKDIDTKEIDRIVKVTNESVNNSWDVVIAKNRYDVIEDLINVTYTKGLEESETISDKIDKVLTHKVFALPIFFIAMFIVFSITFGKIGTWFADGAAYLLDDVFTVAVENFFVNAGASEWAISLVVGGIIPGVGMILTFLPQILILFFFIALLEDVGYMARAAFIMDRTLRGVGLSGKAFVPMIMGFGCSVPAIMATRTLNSERDRRLAIILTPFMSCGARLPIYLMFTSYFFVSNQTFVILSMYLLGVVVALICGLILKNTALKDTDSSFILELPSYRKPTAKNISTKLKETAGGYIKKAGTILLVASIIIWTAQYFTPTFQIAATQQESIMGVVGSFIAPIFAPLGFGTWQATVSLITGFIAKEAVVSTMEIIYTPEQLTSAFTQLSAYSFMVFTLLYMPCIVAFSTIKKEMVTWKWTIFTVAFQTAVAWFVAFIVYQVGGLFF